MDPVTNAGVMARCLDGVAPELIAEREAQTVRNIEDYLRHKQ